MRTQMRPCGERTGETAPVNLYWRLLWLLMRSRRRPRTVLWETTVTPFRVLPTDLDALGHMNNAKYFAFMDLGRLDQMFRGGFFAAVNARGWYSVVASQTIRYRSSLKPWHRFEVHTRVIGFDDKAMYIDSRFVRRGKVAAHAVAQARFLQKAGGDVTPAQLSELLPDMPELTLPAWVATWAGAVREGL